MRKTHFFGEILVYETDSTTNLEHFGESKIMGVHFSNCAIGKFRVENLNVGRMIFIAYMKYGRKITKTEMDFTDCLEDKVLRKAEQT